MRACLIFFAAKKIKSCSYLLVVSICFCWIPNFETSLRFPGVIHGQDVLIRVNGRILISFAGHSRESHSLLHWSSCVLRVFKGAKIGTVALHQVFQHRCVSRRIFHQKSTDSVLMIFSFSPKRMGIISTPLPCGNQGDDGGTTEGGRTLVDPLGGICEGHIWRIWMKVYETKMKQQRWNQQHVILLLVGLGVLTETGVSTYATFCFHWVTDAPIWPRTHSSTNRMTTGRTPVSFSSRHRVDLYGLGSHTLLGDGCGTMIFKTLFALLFETLSNFTSFREISSNIFQYNFPDSFSCHIF